MALPAVQNFDVPTAQAGILDSKALALRAIAAGGTSALQTAAANQGAQAQLANGAAMTAAANSQLPGQGAASGFAAQQSQQAASGFEPLQRAAQMTGDAGQAFTGLISQANENYGNQVASAVPLVHEQTQRELQSLAGAAQQKQADRDQARALAQLQASTEKERLANERASLAQANDPNSLDNQLKRQALTKGQYEIDHPGPILSPSQQADAATLAKQQQRDTNLETLISQVGPDTQAAKALQRAIAGNENNPNQAYTDLGAIIDSGQITTPNGKKLDLKYMQDLLDHYYAGKAGVNASGPKSSTARSNAPSGSVLNPGVGSSYYRY